MKRTPWRGVLKNECNESSGSFKASARPRYGGRGKAGRSRLLDEICALCGYERKYASKLLGGVAGRSREKAEVVAEARRGFTLRWNAK